MITPDYCEQFRCIGGECLHNCCKGGWEIEIDDDALKRFNAIEGEFGERVRAAISDNDTFIRKDGQCPLLNADGLCDMALNGEQLCIVCDEYPRFTEFYDSRTERGISLSCEAAARIILGNANKVKLIGGADACDEPLFVLVEHSRGEIFKLLQDRNTDIFKQIRLALDYSAHIQDKINNNDYSIDEYTPKDTCKKPKSLSAFIGFIRELDILNDKWRNMLDDIYKSEEKDVPHRVDEIKYEQLAVYFVYRYFLKAVFDCDVLSKMKLAALSVMTIAAADAVLDNTETCARMYSEEIEHNEDNIDAIYDEFLFNDNLSYENIINMIN